MRPWRPEDHDSGVVSGATPVVARGGSAADGLGAARALWSTQCASCHGEGGHGDGPQAPLFRPADLAAQSTQSKPDADLARAITSGRGRMPAFGDRMPPEAVDLMVRLVRTFR